MLNYGESLVCFDKIKKLENLLLSVKNLDGCIAEVGVFRGGTALKMSLIEKNSEIHLFDTFEGMPNFSKNYDKDWKKGSFKDTSYEEVKKIFSNNKNVHIYKGMFPQETGKFIIDKKFKFVHLDVDNYESYIDSLNFFYEKIIDDGIIIFDDYEEKCCPGAKKAVDEFFKNKEKIIFDKTYFIIKEKK